METAAAELVENRKISRMVAVPYLFFPGLILRRNVLGGLERLEKAYPQVPITVTPPLGADRRVIGTAARRIRQVWQSIQPPG